MFTLEDLSELVGGQVSGDPGLLIRGINPFELAGPDEITLAVDSAYLGRLEETRAVAVIVPPGTSSQEKALLAVKRPKLAFAQILARFAEEPFSPIGISSQAVVGRNCRIAEEVSIHPLACVGDEVVIESAVTLFPGVSVGNGCRIGAGSTLHPNVTLYSGVTLGKRVIIHSGTVIGADGFGYVFDGFKQVKIHQVGKVEIGNDVEIGANSCVDRAAFGATVIEDHVKLDNHVHIGHNCKVGENTIIVGCVGVSGSVQIGKNCILAGQSGVSDHVRIGDGARIMQKTAVTRDVPSGATVSGLYSRDHRKELRIQAVLQKLPEIYRDWQKMKKKIAEEE